MNPETGVGAVIEDLSEDDSGDGDDDDGAEADPTEPDRTEEEETIRRLRERVDRLESHAESLEDDLDERDDRIAELEGELEESKREERIEARTRRAVSRLERETDRLERERDEAQERVADLERKVETLKELWRLDHSNFETVAGDRDLVPVKTVEQFTTDALRAADERYGLAREDVVYLRDASGPGRSTAEALAETEPRLVPRAGHPAAPPDAAPVAPAGPGVRAGSDTPVAASPTVRGRWASLPPNRA